MMAKVQPIDTNDIANDHSKPPAPATKSRLKRLFERPFHGVIRRSSSTERLSGADLDPSSVCLDKMVRNFMEDNVAAAAEKSNRCSRSRCNCFNGNDSSSDVEDDSVDSIELLKSLVVCTSLTERNLLADVSGLVEKSKHIKRKDECRKAVAESLRSLGHNAYVCKSRWESTPSIPAGEYEFIDVMDGNGERLLVDIEFRSEFEVARSTKSYRAVLQCLPCIFVGRADRLSQIVGLVSESARLSLKKKELHFPPWRKPEYMRAKWLAPYTRVSAKASEQVIQELAQKKPEFEEKIGFAESEAEVVVAVALPEVKPKLGSSGAKVVTGFTVSATPS